MPSLNGFGSPQRHTGSVAEPESELALLTKKFEQYQQFDKEKEKFHAELLTRIEYLIQERETVTAQRQRDAQLALSWETERAQYMNWYKGVIRVMTENSFVMVLIDGDGMIFNDGFIQQGETGGLRAASLLYTAVQEWAEVSIDPLPVKTRIVCRMYANVKGLGDVLVRKGLIPDNSVFEDFVRGFTRGKATFDFVDVGSGKDRADKKIIESLHMFSQDMHCRRVLFGCSHDNGYARTLEEHVDKMDVVEKVVLLEGVPFEKELLSLPYSTHKFPGLFRDTKISLNGATYYNAPANGAAPGSPKIYNMLAGMPSRFPPPRPAIMDSPLPSKAALAMSNGLPRTPSSSTIASDGFQAQVQATAKPINNAWAAVAAAKPPPEPEQKYIPKPSTVVREESIARNRAGQRIDPSCQLFDKDELNRVKRMKMCNVHYLRGTCPYGPKCSHSHDLHPSNDELLTLRLVARMSPCINGSGCQELKCIYGHRCPAPLQNRTGSMRGTKGCVHGDSCKFPQELHDIDTTVVKTLVIR